MISEIFRLFFDRIISTIIGVLSILLATKPNLLIFSKLGLKNLEKYKYVLLISGILMILANTIIIIIKLNNPA